MYDSRLPLWVYQLWYEEDREKYRVLDEYTKRIRIRNKIADEMRDTPINIVVETIYALELLSRRLFVYRDCVEGCCG